MVRAGGVDVVALRALVRSRLPASPLAGQPGAQLAGTLADRLHVLEVDGHPRVDLQHLAGEELVDLLVATGRQAAWTEAVQLAAVAELAHRRPVEPDRWRRDRADEPFAWSRYAADEIAVALHLTNQAARARLDTASGLSRLPGTAAALLAGRLDARRAQVIVDGVAAVPHTDAGDAALARIETDVLVRAEELTTAGLRRAVARAVLRHDPAAVAERERAARRDRHVEVCPAGDGMAWLSALLPAVAASACHQRLTALAHATSPEPERSEQSGQSGQLGAPARDDRSLDERRADVLVDLLLGRDQPRTPPVAVQVHVTVPAATVAGVRDAPGELAGYGPISAHTARRLLGTTAAGDPAVHDHPGVPPAERDAPDLAPTGSDWPQTWRRLLTDPVSGTLLDVGQRTYRPPVALDRHVALRDQRCRFPGCRQPATRCDRDHVTRYPDGPTAAWNLASLCRHHHRLKHEAGWQLQVIDGAGGLRWITPTGHQHTTHPEPHDHDPPDAPARDVPHDADDVPPF